MNLIKKFKSLFINTRSFHLSIPHNGQGKVMKKIMHGTKASKKKFKYHDTPLLPTPTAFSKGSFEGGKSGNARRSSVLNKLFMMHITDLMACGECSSAFVGHGIEINRVQVTPDYTCINVFWIASGTSQDDIVERILSANSGILRNELAQLKLVGMIPRIKFVKDKQYARVVELDRILSKADFGDDYEPIDLSSRLKTQLELNTKIEPHIMKQIHKLETEDSNYHYEEIPPMSNDVFGLNYSYIMENIKKSKKKSQALHRLQPVNDEDPTITTNENPVIFASVQEERQAFKEFLEKQQILKNKAQKEAKNYRPEQSYLEDEWYERQKLGMNYSKDEGEDDFIDDDDK